VASAAASALADSPSGLFCGRGGLRLGRFGLGLLTLGLFGLGGFGLGRFGLSRFTRLVV